MKQEVEEIRKDRASINDLIKMFEKMSKLGYGEYIVFCNDEYLFAKKDEIPDICFETKTLSYGGYI